MYEKECKNYFGYSCGNVPLRCTDGCPFSDSCMYNAVNLYTKGADRYFVHKFECGDKDEDIINALRTNPYGRCVYRCDNDVCDRQVAAMELDNGICAVFTVSAFSQKNTRTIKLMGTEGELGGCIEEGELVLKRFAENTEKKFVIPYDNTRHCGGDSGLIDYFVSEMSNPNYKLDKKIFSAHRLTFRAEKSRLDKTSV